jgi:tryptophan synthase alpha chain
VTIDETFADLRRRKEMALITYTMGGFPTLLESLDHLAIMAEYGADILEVGVPFSDPIADGPTIQCASQQALRHGTTLEDILSGLHSIEVQRPIVLMSYLNPLAAYGRQRLLDDAPSTGIKGLIIPDLPIEEASDWLAWADPADVSLICLVAPTSPDERVRAIARQSSGFLYCVSLTGTTGVRSELGPELDSLLDRVRKATAIPVAVGFGVSSPDHVRALHGKADGVVVGSRIVKAISEGEDMPRLVRALKEATRSNNRC